MNACLTQRSSHWMVTVTTSRHPKPKWSGCLSNKALLHLPTPFPVWPSFAFIFLLRVQSECCVAAGTQPAKEGVYHSVTTLTTNYKISTTLPQLSLTQSSFFLCLFLYKLINTQASILQKGHFAITAVLFVFWAAGLQVISRPPDIHWQTSVPLTLQSLQFSRVIYGARKTHPPCLLLSAFMMLDSRSGPSHLCLIPPLLGEHCTFSVSHNPITPLRPRGGAIRATRHPARGVVLSLL